MIIKKSKRGVSPWTFLLPLIVAFVVIAVVVINAQQTQQTVSQASYSGLQQCTNDCNSNNPQIANRIKNKGKCTLDCPKVIDGSMTCQNFCSRNVRGAEGQNKVSGLCMLRCRKWVKAGAEEIEQTTGATGTTGSETSFNCSTKCANFQGAQQSQCVSTCNAFNAGTKTCPSGCQSEDPLVSAACFRLFCPTRVP